MSSDHEYGSDLEVVSKDMAASTMSDDSEHRKDSGQDTPHMVDADGHAYTSVKLDTTKATTDGGHSIDRALNSDSPSMSGIISPQDADSDPMLASAIASPLYAPLNFESIWSPARTVGGKPALQRAPSILQRAHTAGNDWELYKRAGPPYPTSLDQLIMKYHQRHSNSWQLAHDLGAGSGVYATNLARFFRHIHVSDPSPSGIATSRSLLSTWSAKNPKKRGRFTFSSGKPEVCEEHFTDGSVDLVTLMEGAHFTNAEETVKAVAKTLAPGGTLAIVTHRPVAKCAGNERVAEAVERLFEAWGRRPWDVACGTETKSQQQFSLGLDFVRLPSDLFAVEKIRRITINAHGNPREVFRVPGMATQSDGALNGEEVVDSVGSCVRDKEQKLAYGERDEQGRGWRFEVGWESFRTRVALLDTPATVKRLEPYLREIQTLIEKTSPTGTLVVIEWAVAVVLATRT